MNMKMHYIKKLLRALTSYLRLTTGAYKREPLADYNFCELTSKWPYKDPHCVSDAFGRKNDSEIDLSICIPMFNAQNSIVKLLTQLFNQNSICKIEVLLVDDGSTDETSQVVEKLIENKANYHLFIQENKGLSAARNKAIDNSSGKYLTFVDADDEICDGFIDKLMMTAINQNSDIVRGQYCSRSGKSKLLNFGTASSYAWGKVYHASLFNRVRFPNGYWFEDMINSFLLIPLSKKSIDVDTPVIIHNDVENSLSKSQLSSLSYKTLEQLYLVMSLVDNYRALGLTDKDYLHKRILTECSQLMVRRTEKLDNDTKKQVFLACNRLFTENRIKSKEFSGLDRMFADAIINKDYAAWKMTADYAYLYLIIERFCNYKNLLR